jgi:integrase
VQNGAPLELIQEAMGHANLSTTMVYAHLSTSKRRTDLTRFLEARPDDTGGEPGAKGREGGA